MIVDPDFLDHWRTKMLSDALGDDAMAPLYVMRIWAHCQSRRATRFDSMPAAGLKALCRFAGDAATLERGLIDAGFVVRDGAAIDVPKWAEHNAKLISNWTNGSKGGRPKQTEEEPNGNPTETQLEPTVTHPEPIRGEEIGEEKNTKPKSKAEDATASRLPKDWTPSAEDISFCKTERQDLDPIETGKRFRDYWIAKAGKEGRKSDWPATWRNWVRNERIPQARGSPGYKTNNEKQKEFADRLTGKTRHERPPEFIDLN